ncbi:MAG: molecular chaperone TorD family protein [Acidilobaceae archaeon]
MDSMDSLRSNVYLALSLFLLGFPEAKNVSYELGIDISECKLEDLKASKLRLDYDAASRSLLPKAVSDFYERYGFKAQNDADSLVAMLAFMAQLSRDKSLESIKAQVRFLNVHLIPLLKMAIELNVCPQLIKILDIINEDLKYLMTKLEFAETHI